MIKVYKLHSSFLKNYDVIYRILRPNVPSFRCDFAFDYIEIASIFVFIFDHCVIVASPLEKPKAS